MITTLSPRKPRYEPAVGPIGDAGRVFRRLGGWARLDIVVSMLSIACVAFWSCVRTGKRKAMNVSLKPAVYLLTYIPAEQLQDVA